MVFKMQFLEQKSRYQLLRNALIKALEAAGARKGVSFTPLLAPLLGAGLQRWFRVNCRKFCGLCREVSKSCVRRPQGPQ